MCINTPNVILIEISHIFSPK